MACILAVDAPASGERRVEVNRVNEAVHGLGLDVAGPVGQRADAGCAFVERALALAIRAVVAGERHLRHVGHDAGELRAARAAVVAVKEDERVLAHLLLVERGDDAADLVIKAGDHAGISAARGVFDVAI